MNLGRYHETTASTDYEWWTLDRITINPSSTYVEVIKDAWWCFDDRGRVLMYRDPDDSIIPQCDHTKGICERLANRFADITEIRQLPLALVPIRVVGVVGLGDY